MVVLGNLISFTHSFIHSVNIYLVTAVHQELPGTGVTLGNRSVFTSGLGEKDC